MNAVEFLRSLYLGDRACKAITIDGWNASIRITVDTISRVRSPSGQWDHDTAEDIANGVIVFEGASFIDLKNHGALPNDVINSIEAKAAGEFVEVRMSIDSVADDATHHETTLTVRCKTVHIEDPSRPGQKIIK
jgi:hypothetical protein